MRVLPFAFLTIAAWILVTCSDDSDGFDPNWNPESDGGSDSDSDADADNDVDTDADADNDADSDSDSDADSDSDGDADSDSDGDADSDSDSDADSDSDSDADSDSDSDSDSDCADGPFSKSLANCDPVMPAPTGDYYQDCVDHINVFRAECQCLPPLTRWTSGEDCADEQAQYDYEHNTAHAGFSAGICTGGWAQCECPDWDSVESITQGTQWYESCLAMMWHEVDKPAGEQGHYEAMSSTQHSQVACGVYTAPGGSTWATQNYK
jgi:hypothetical protein